MPTENTPFDPSPNDPQKSLVQKVLVYAFDTDNNQIPMKTLKITSNATFTVYPVMRDGDEAETAKGSGVKLYDPYDPAKTEYRGFIGYKGTDDNYYFGLQKGQTITIQSSAGLLEWGTNGPSASSRLPHSSG